MCKMMSEKLANKRVPPNTCIHPCPTLDGLIEPIHHTDWINLPFEDTSPFYTKLSESELFLLFSPFYSLALSFFFLPYHFYILLKTLR